MVSIKNSLVAIFMLIALNGISQDRKWRISDDWRINAALSFSPGLQTENTQSISLNGYLGFLKDRIHIRGDAFYFLNQYGDRPRFAMNHQLYFGALYHFSEKQFQPYLGFQPGIALTQSSEYGSLNSETGLIEYKKSINPLGSPIAGFTYYGEKLFFLFFETRYIFGKHKTNTYPVFLDELRFSFGLGLTF